MESSFQVRCWTAVVIACAIILDQSKNRNWSIGHMPLIGIDHARLWILVESCAYLLCEGVSSFQIRCSTTIFIACATILVRFLLRFGFFSIDVLFLGIGVYKWIVVESFAYLWCRGEVRNNRYVLLSSFDVFVFLGLHPFSRIMLNVLLGPSTSEIVKVFH